MYTFGTYKTEEEKRDFLSYQDRYTISTYLDDSTERVEKRIDELKTYPKTKTLVAKFERELRKVLKLNDDSEREETLNYLCEEIESKLEDRALQEGYSVMYHPDNPGEYMAFKQYKCKRCQKLFDAMSDDLCTCIWEV